METENEKAVPQKKSEKIVLAEVFVEDDLYDYRYKFNSPSQGMMLLALLQKLSSEVLKDVYSLNDKIKVEGEKKG